MDKPNPPPAMNITEIRKVLKCLAEQRGLSAFYRRHRLKPRTMARVKKKGWHASDDTLAAVQKAIAKDRAKGLLPEAAQ